jgi:hypothetical protein
VTAKVSFLDRPKPVRDPADHVSLSSIFNCQKTDGKIRPNPRKRKTNPNQSPAQFSTASSETFRASSAAARSATALVDERRYKPTITDTSTGYVTFF